MDLLGPQNFRGCFPVIGGAYIIGVTHSAQAQHLTQCTVILHDEDCQFFRRWLFLHSDLTRVSRRKPNHSASGRVHRSLLPFDNQIAFFLQRRVTSLLCSFHIFLCDAEAFSSRFDFLLDGFELTRPTLFPKMQSFPQLARDDSEVTSPPHSATFTD